MRFAEFFKEDNRFRFIENVRQGAAPWSCLDSIEQVIQKFLVGKKGTGIEEVDELSPNGASPEDGITAIRTMIAKQDILLKGYGIFIGEGTLVEAGALIKGHCVFGKNNEIRQGAYIRGNVITGEACVAGHVTEVKNSIFMDHSHAGHFAYVGDSVLGSHVNLGAGVKLANLRFRSRDEIGSGNIKEINVEYDGTVMGTGRAKLGAVIGDYTEIGCNTVTAPGALIGADCWVYPNSTIPGGLRGAGVIIRNAGALKVETLKRHNLV